MEFQKFYTMAPMKYYQPTNYKAQKAIDILANKDNGYIATRKYDGEWCRVIIDADGNVTAQSRNISKVTGEYGDKTNHIPHIINEFSKFPKETVVLGELCFIEKDSTSRDVGTILRCLPQKAIDRQKNHKLVFRAFDCLAANGNDLMGVDYEHRFRELVDLVGGIQGLEYIILCDYVESNFEDYLQTILAEGGEGIVIHSKDYKYQAGGRPAWKTMKVKKITEELELPVVAAIEPNREYEGKELDNWKYYVDDKPVTKPFYMGWKNGVIVNNGGTLVRVASGLTDADREWLATDEARVLIANSQLFATVSAMEVTPDGSLRHPRLIRLRTDMGE